MLSKYIRDNIAQEMLAQSAHIYFRRKIGGFKYASKFLIGYYITEQSWAFLFNVGSEVYLLIAGQRWTGADIDWNISIDYGFTKFAKILIVKIKFHRSSFHRISHFTIKVNSENQWFLPLLHIIGFHQLPCEIIDNIFANLCLENEVMHSIIALVCKRWIKHINKEFVEK